MRALVIDKIGHTKFTEKAKPVPQSDKVLLKVNHVGLCGSDLNTFRGANPLVQLPRTPGHEIGGTIVELGDAVSSNLQVGQAAIVIPYTNCGQCASCKKGRLNACQFNQTLGVQQEGGLCEFISVRADRLIVNESLAAIHLALVEPLSVGFHAVERGCVSSKDTVLVLGGGMIGVGAILGAKAKGATVLVAEISSEKTAILNKIGAQAMLNPSVQDLEEEVSKLTGGAGPDVVIECVGLPETFRSAVDLVSFAGRIVYVGYSKSEVSYNTSLFNLKELDIMGSRNATRSDFEAVIAFLEQNSAIADSLISKTFTLEEADQAFDYWQDNRDRTFKILIEIDQS